MKSLMQQALGEAWDHLPPALKAHYRPGRAVDLGLMDVAFPGFMQGPLAVLSRLGALVGRRGRAVQTRVEKFDRGDRQTWRRMLCYADGHEARFDSEWALQPDGRIIEQVNRWLALEMQPFVVGNELHYRGIRFIVRIAGRMLTIPEWMALGHTTIHEWALDDRHFEMDFRMTHPVLGQVFRYSGRFLADADLTDPLGAPH